MLHRIRLRGLVVLGLFAGLPVCAEWSPEAGGLLSRSYTPRTYQASPQNWAAVQDSRGIMYFGNTECVLEYDGVSWRKIPVSNGSGVRSLAVDANGTVYVGAQGEFGYLKPDARGTLAYVSLVDRIPADARKFADVWSVLPLGDAVFFGTYQGLYRWSPRGNSMRIWKPAKRFGRFSMADGTIYVVAEGAGLQRMRNESWEPVPGGENFTSVEVRGVLSGKGGMQLLTRTGVYRYDGKAFQKITGPVTGLLADREIHAGMLMEEGSLVLATLRAGLILLNPDGSVSRVGTKVEGLLSDSITSLFRDREGGLWITSSAGIQRIELAMTQFGRAEGLNGSAYCIGRFQGRLYAGTDVGLFALRTIAGAQPRFEPVADVKLAVYALTATAHGMLAATQDGVYQIVAGRATPVLREGAVLDVGISHRDPQIAFAAGRYWIQQLQWDGSAWKSVSKLPSGGSTFRSVAEDTDGRTWVATQNEILRVDWTNQKPSSEVFDSSHGVPAGFKNVYRLRGEIVVATVKGLLRFDPGGSSFIPWTGFGTQFADGARPVSIVAEGARGSVWITGKGYHGRLDPSPPSWHPMPLLRSGQSELYALLQEADGTVWAAGPDGFIVRHEPALTPPARPLDVHIRRVQVPGGFIAYGGAGTLESQASLTYAQNTLRFEFAAPFHEDSASVEYQVRLDSADPEWSAWTTETHKDFTHLFEGHYSFLVRARTPYGAVSPEASIAFSVLPPWYRTWWAMLTYGFVAAGTVWILIRWRVRKLEEEKEKLEVIVEERTVEIRRQRDQIQLEEQRTQTLLLNILPSAVAAELKDTGTVQPQSYDDVTVCFTDFVGFSLSSEHLPAGKLVSSLHEYFTSFDEVVETYGLEKLKTIGDSYMLVSGLPHPRQSHAVDAVMGALRIAEIVRKMARRNDGATWDVRIGLNSGSVAAGVVGVRKFAFDIWGNTVNLASRMESSGIPGLVNLSWPTYTRVKDFFDCESRGSVATKDKREFEMYFVRGLHADLQDPKAFRELYKDRFGDYPVYDVEANRLVGAAHRRGEVAHDDRPARGDVGK